LGGVLQKRHVNIILGILAFFVVCAVLLVAGGAWFAMSILDHEDADEQTARAAFSAARERFPGATPIFELRPEGPALTRPVPATGRANLHTMHILNWDPAEESLIRADLPFSLLRMKEGPIDLADAARNGYGGWHGVSIRVSDIERFGPALLMDEELEGGHRVLIWTE
jgi:hypothetical protein